MNGFISDLRSGIRILLRQPLNSGCLILIISVSVGVNVAAISLIQSIIFPPLGVRAPHQLFRVYVVEPRNQQLVDLSHPQTLALQDALPRAVGGCANFKTALTLGPATAILTAQAVTSDAFDVLGVSPRLGRTFAAGGTSGAAPEIVLSHALWMRVFGGTDEALGTSVTLNGERFYVTGVMPEGFSGILRLSPADLWLSTASVPQLRVPQLDLSDQARWLQGFARVENPSAVSAVAQRLAGAIRHGGAARDRDGSAVRLVPADDVIVHPSIDRRWHRLAIICTITSGLVFLLGCASLAGSLLVRAAARRKEVAIRRALGASRFRVLRQLTAEAGVLGVIGGVGGLLVGSWAFRVLAVNVYGMLPVDRRFRIDTPLDVQSIVIAAVGCVAMCVVCAAVSGMRVSRSGRGLIGTSEDLTSAIQSHSGKTLNLLIVPQIAISLLLLFCAGLFIVSAQKNRVSDLGYATENRGFVALDLDLHGYDATRGRQLFETALQSIRQLSDVQFAGITEWPSVDGEVRAAGIRAARDSSSRVTFARAFQVGPRVLEIAGMTILHGRHFRSGDETRDVVLVDKGTAQNLWGERSPIGELVRVEFGKFVGGKSSGQLLEVIGVVADVRDVSSDNRGRARLYLPWGSQPVSKANLYVQTEIPQSTLRRVQQVLRAIDPHVTALHSSSMEDYALQLDHASVLAGMWLMAFGGFGFIVAAVGVFCAVEYAIRRRSKEIAIRAALGASPIQIAKTVTGWTISMALTGLAMGTAMSLVGDAVVQDYLQGGSGIGLAVLPSLFMVLFFMALATCVIPVRRAIRADVIAALRQD